MTPQIKPTKKDIQDNIALAILGYISILCFVPLLFKKDSPFAQFHAKQGLALFIIEVAAWLLAFTVFLAPLSGLIYIGCFIVAIYGIYQVVSGKTEPIPVLSTIVQKLNI